MAAPSITFTGKGKVGVRAFISWMESWYSIQGAEYKGNTPESQKLRVAQLRIACPGESEAGLFLNQLLEEILGDEEKLKKALIEQFDEIGADDNAQDDILSIMKEIEQGEQTVFSYSRKVSRILRRKLSNVRQVNKALISYYIDGLANKRLRDMAIMSFQKPDSNESPITVVKGVKRFARQLKLKGYKKGGCNGDIDSSNEEESSDDDESSSTSDSDEDRTYKYSKKSSRKSKKSDKRSGKKSDKSQKKNRHSGEDAVANELKQFHEMMQDWMKSQKPQGPSTELVNTRSDPDVIPLDSYAVNRTYGSYPQQERSDYLQFNQGQSTNRQSQYPNRRGQARPAIADYNRTLGRTQEQTSMQPTTFESSQNSYAPLRGASSSRDPIVGPGGALYYLPRSPPICYHCGEEGHIRPNCPRLRPYIQQSSMPEDGQPSSQRTDNVLPLPPPPPAAARRSDQVVSVVKIVTASSAFDGVKVREVTVAEVDEKLMKFVKKVEEDGNEGNSDFSDIDAPVMAGERAQRFSNLPPELDGEAGPASQRQRTGNVEEANPKLRGIRQPIPRVKRKHIRMMAGRERFDFVGAFRDVPVLGLNWGSFFDLVPVVKKDICRLLVQERAKDSERGRTTSRGKKVSVDTETQGTPGDEEVHAIAKDRDLGDVTNFYTRGTIKTKKGRYRIIHILVDAGSVVNLMPIKLLKSIGGNLKKANGMVVRTATNALARIAYFADLRITVAGIPCDLSVYALPAEYSPTYPMLLSRRWLQAVKAKGDYATGRYYIANGHGTWGEIPSQKKDRGKVRETEHWRRSRVPIVLRDQEAGTNQLSVEVEEELELQETQGNNFFERLIELIREEAEEQMKREDEEDDAYESGTSEDSEN